MKKYLKKNKKIKLKGKRKGEMKITYGSNKKIKNFIKISNFTSIESGLRSTLNWYSSFKFKKLIEIHK